MYRRPNAHSVRLNPSPFFGNSLIINIFVIMDNIKLKKIIFNKLYEDLSHAEIIPYRNSIWFIDREKEYWYIEYEKSGKLYWRWSFFTNFFMVFSMKQSEFELIISEWVEEVLNCKVETPISWLWINYTMVEEVLNCKVETPAYQDVGFDGLVEEVLNCKVVTPCSWRICQNKEVEEVLNCKVVTPIKKESHIHNMVGEVLNTKVNTTSGNDSTHQYQVEEMLNIKVSTTETHWISPCVVEVVLNS